MTSPRSLCGIASLLLLALLGVVSSNTVAEEGTQQTSIPGKQFMVARYTSTPPVIDGVFSPGEWQGAIPVYVDGSTPATAPGVVPNIPGLPFLFPPDSPASSSFTIYTLYDDNNLYIAVDVNDNIVICDGPVPFLDDDAEIMIDGDRRPGDVHMATNCGPNNPNCPNPVVNNEGFQLVTSVCNQSLTAPPNNPSIVWESKAGCVRTVTLWSFEYHSIPSTPSTRAGSPTHLRVPVSGARNRATSSALMSQSEMTTTVASAMLAPNPVPIMTATWLGVVEASAGMSTPNRIGETCF